MKLGAFWQALPTIAELAGMVLAAYGLALVFFPAGIVAAGLGLMVLAQGAEK